MPESVVFPLTALVGQDEMKDALLLAAVNPRVQGVLLIGGKGTGKTTAARGLLPLLPTMEFSMCGFGCLPAMALDDPESLCSDCRDKLARGEPISYRDTQKVVELPLNAGLDDVVGGASARTSLEQHRLRFEAGLLAHANRNILYIDEINLLDEAVVDAILDAAATGVCVVRRGRLAASYPSEFVLIGSMNPEEGDLRPQILDRIGLRVNVSPCRDPEERIEIAARARKFRLDPAGFVETFAPSTRRAAENIEAAREAVAEVELTPEAERFSVMLATELEIGSHRAEIVMMEAARALAAIDRRPVAEVADVVAVAPLSLRRRKSGLAGFEEEAVRENEAIDQAVKQLLVQTGSITKERVRATGRRRTPAASSPL